jgi:hypothetical protein
MQFPIQDHRVGVGWLLAVLMEDASWLHVLRVRRCCRWLLVSYLRERSEDQLLVRSLFKPGVIVSRTLALAQ